MSEEIKCLDHGFVRLVDHMGDDSAIVQAARVSYGKGTKSVNEDRGLIRYLMRHWHTTPFEMVEFKFHCKMPMFVARQWIRHRTANVNEYSARYSILDKEFYIPEEVHSQSKENKQGRGGLSPDECKANFQANTDKLGNLAYELYEGALEDNIARELARMNLPVNYYTQWYWKIDLHNLFHFLRLRMDSHAQYEIRVYADAIYELIKPYVPIAVEAFEDYRLNAVSFSAPEMQALRTSVQHMRLDPERFRTESMSKRECKEFVNKLGMGINND